MGCPREYNKVKALREHTRIKHAEIYCSNKTFGFSSNNDSATFIDTSIEHDSAFVLQGAQDDVKFSNAEAEQVNKVLTINGFFLS